MWRDMKIIAVDNFTNRLTQLHELLGDIFHGNEISAFVDPFFAVQHSMKHGVDIVFVQSNLRPLNYINISYLVHKFNEKAKVYLIVDDLSSIDKIDRKVGIAGYAENPLDREKIESLLPSNTYQIKEQI